MPPNKLFTSNGRKKKRRSWLLSKCNRKCLSRWHPHKKELLSIWVLNLHKCPWKIIAKTNTTTNGKAKTPALFPQSLFKLRAISCHQEPDPLSSKLHMECLLSKTLRLWMRTSTGPQFQTKDPSEVFIRTILLDKQASKGSSTSKIKSNYLNFTFLGRRRLKEQGSIQWRTIAQMRESLGWGICQRLNMFLLGQERWVSRLAKGNTRGEEGLVPNKGASLTLETTAKTSWNLTRETLSHTRSSTTNHSWMRQRACRLQISCLLNPTLLT